MTSFCIGLILFSLDTEIYPFEKLQELRVSDNAIEKLNISISTLVYIDISQNYLTGTVRHL